MALPACCLCLCIHLERIASVRQAHTTQEQKQRRMCFDGLMCWGLPAIYMALRKTFIVIYLFCMLILLLNRLHRSRPSIRHCRRFRLSSYYIRLPSCCLSCLGVPPHRSRLNSDLCRSVSLPSLLTPLPNASCFRPCPMPLLPPSHNFRPSPSRFQLRSNHFSILPTHAHGHRPDVLGCPHHRPQHVVHL